MKTHNIQANTDSEEKELHKKYCVAKTLGMKQQQ